MIEADALGCILEVSAGFLHSSDRAITGRIFEFGFSDAILQMWAAFLYELENGIVPKKFAGAATPEEAALSHRLFTASLESQRMGTVVAV